MINGNYQSFLAAKAQFGSLQGFDPVWMPDFLFEFQSSLVEWAIRKGRAAIFADCGLGKTPMALVWAENIVRETNRPVLILTPLAVGTQFLEEAAKFGIEASRSRSGDVRPGINISNYQRLHYFDPQEFSGVVCDESSVLKSFDATTRAAVTEFLRTIPYRLLTTATAAPNDTIELGTSAEALGELGYMDMLSRFFVNDQKTSDPRRNWTGGNQWRFKGHAEQPFWCWVSSWARACRKPSDLGFDDGEFKLPPKREEKTMIKSRQPADGLLFDLPAVGLQEERDLRRRTITERSEAVAERVLNDNSAVIWCHLNAEGDLLEKIIPNSAQVSGSHSDEKKEEIFSAFKRGEIQRLITKPKIGAWGLNWEHCSHVTYFPSHSYEQYYQAVRRCWRFGQKREVLVDLICTEADSRVFANLQRKSEAADRMFDHLVQHMNDAITIRQSDSFDREMEVPTWL